MNKNESNFSDYIPATELLVKFPVSEFVVFFIYPNLLWRQNVTWVNVDENNFFSNKLHEYVYMSTQTALCCDMIRLAWSK